MASLDRFQVHLVLPYKQQPAGHPRVRRHLEEGYRIAHLQRLSDREALVTFERRPADR